VWETGCDWDLFLPCDACVGWSGFQNPSCDTGYNWGLRVSRGLKLGTAFACAGFPGV